jgi:hypothetical protein
MITSGGTATIHVPFPCWSIVKSLDRVLSALKIQCGLESICFLIIIGLILGGTRV